MPDRADLKHLMRFQNRNSVLVHPAILPGKSLDVPLVEINETASGLLKYSTEELLSLNLSDIDTAQDFPTDFVDTFVRDGFACCERTYTAKDGTCIPVEIDAYAVSLGGTPMCVTVARDISSRKAAEEERTLNEQRFKALYALTRMIDESEQAIMDFALEESVRLTKSSIGYITLVNDNESKLFLHAWSKDVMKDCQVFKPKPAYKLCETGLLGDAVRQRKPVITNDYPQHPDKRDLPDGHIPIHRHLSMPVMDNGQIVMVAGVGNKSEPYTESDVMQLSLFMEGMWRIVQRKRMEKALIEATQTARKASEAKSLFLANMSHELRTPLNGILGMTQILMGTDLTPSQQEYLSLSLEAGRHLTKVLTDLLSLSCVEAGRLELAQTEFNLPQTMDQLIAPLSPNAAEKSLILTLDIDPGVPTHLIGDAGKLRQILINLLFNAIKFTEEGEVGLTISKNGTSDEPDTDTCTLNFSVTDTGIGIPPEQHETIFDSFTLGEDYLTKQFGGTGLGLSISWHLADLMGGQITVDSALGKGSTFTLTLPFRVRHTTPHPTAAETAPATHHHGALSILLAEDEQVNSIMASRLLKKAGHSVTIVGNGQQAIEALSTTSFDLVLMDVQMPVINGIQATEIIRSGAVENVPKDLPIIGLTAFARASEKNRFMEAGMELIVTKPYEAEELIQAVATIMHP